MLSAFLLATLAPCPIEQAEYRVRGTPTATARFYAVPSSVDWPSGLALRVQVPASGRSYWFLPWQGGTDGATHIAWVRERSSPFQMQTERKDLEILTADRDYAILAEVPKSGDVAPAHMLMPDLGRLVWLSTTDDKYGIPRAFFDFTGCNAARPAVAPEIEFPPIP